MKTRVLIQERKKENKANQGKILQLVNFEGLQALCRYIRVNTTSASKFYAIREKKGTDF